MILFLNFEAAANEACTIYLKGQQFVVNLHKMKECSGRKKENNTRRIDF